MPVILALFLDSEFAAADLGPLSVETVVEKCPPSLLRKAMPEYLFLILFIPLYINLPICVPLPSSFCPSARLVGRSSWKGRFSVQAISLRVLLHASLLSPQSSVRLVACILYYGV